MRQSGSRVCGWGPRPRCRRTAKGGPARQAIQRGGVGLSPAGPHRAWSEAAPARACAVCSTSPLTEGTEPLTGSSLDLGNLSLGPPLGPVWGDSLGVLFQTCDRLLEFVLLSRNSEHGSSLSHDVVCWKHICAFKLFKKDFPEQEEKKKKSTWQLPVYEQARRWGVAVTQLVWCRQQGPHSASASPPPPPRVHGSLSPGKLLLILQNPAPTSPPLRPS